MKNVLYSFFLSNHKKLSFKKDNEVWYSQLKNKIILFLFSIMKSTTKIFLFVCVCDVILPISWENKPFMYILYFFEVFFSPYINEKRLFWV